MSGSGGRDAAGYRIAVSAACPESSAMCRPPNACRSEAVQEREIHTTVPVQGARTGNARLRPVEVQVHPVTGEMKPGPEAVEIRAHGARDDLTVQRLLHHADAAIVEEIGHG